jgi:hypothetical protein
MLGALVFFGLDAMGVAEKKGMTALAARGGPYTEEEQKSLLEYCEEDVVGLHRLLPPMLPRIDLPRAFLRGRYMKAIARTEHAGVPIDTEALEVLKKNWDRIQDELIRRVDRNYGVYEGRTFKFDRMAQYVLHNQIPWPTLPSGKLALDDDTFKTMALAYPQVELLRQLRGALSQMRLHELTVGEDGRNRCILSAFGARTGRNTPSSTSFIFGAANWLRGLIQPTEGYGLAYIDWSQQEFGIAGALGRDDAMMSAYVSGDPYLAFGKQAGAIPPDGTKGTHGAMRDQFKECTLATQYGMGPNSLALRIGQPTFQARELLRLHRETYRRFWSWSDAVVDHAMLHGFLNTIFGWTIHTGTGASSNPRFLRNFAVQGNGSELLRLACCLATERGVTLCAPVHDAVLIEAPVGEIDAAVNKTQAAMAEASAIVLNGFVLRSEARIIRHPGRLHDNRGAQMWSTAWDCIGALGVAIPAGMVPA